MCYDVSDPHRLADTYKKMNGYGDPVQYSVFMCELNSKEVILMKEDLASMLNLDEDRVLIIDAGKADAGGKGQIFTMGASIEKKREESIVI